MIFEGCQGKPRTPTIHEKNSPQCGGIIELFSMDTQMYEQMMSIAARNKQKKEDAA